jgi:hypothetical protein
MNAEALVSFDKRRFMSRDRTDVHTAHCVVEGTVEVGDRRFVDCGLGERYVQTLENPPE